jgi:hypothetical protein
MACRLRCPVLWFAAGVWSHGGRGGVMAGGRGFAAPGMALGTTRPGRRRLGGPNTHRAACVVSRAHCPLPSLPLPSPPFLCSLVLRIHSVFGGPLALLPATVGARKYFGGWYETVDVAGDDPFETEVVGIVANCLSVSCALHCVRSAAVGLLCRPCDRWSRRLLALMMRTLQPLARQGHVETWGTRRYWSRR